MLRDCFSKENLNSAMELMKIPTRENQAEAKGSQERLALPIYIGDHIVICKEKNRNCFICSKITAMNLSLRAARAPAGSSE